MSNIKSTDKKARKTIPPQNEITGRKVSRIKRRKKDKIKLVSGDYIYRSPEGRFLIDDWKAYTIINKSNVFEGIVIAHNMAELYNGFFFVSHNSAVKFLKSCVNAPENLLKDILKVVERPNIKFPKCEEADYITSRDGMLSITDRHFLCIYIKLALDRKPKEIDNNDVSFYKERFKYEAKLDNRELKLFIHEKLYNPSRAGDMSVNPLPIDPCEFEVDGVKMYGTRFRADLVSFPSNKSLVEYEIPQYVVQIKTGAFNKANHLQSIRLGNGVKNIESEAFVDNTSLAAITIPSNVQMIEAGAFTRCNNLRMAFIKSKSEDISSNIFVDCRNLESLITPNQNLRNSIKNLRTASLSNVKVKIHREGENNGYPNLGTKGKIVVMGNVFNCLSENHSIKSMWVNVPVAENCIPKKAPICIFKCLRCNRMFILPEIYEYYLTRYKLNTKLFIRLKYDQWYKGRKMWCLNETINDIGVLKALGYNVSEADGLPHSTRINILRGAIECGIISKVEIEYRLQKFIDYNGAKAGNELARSKWQEDLRTIHQMKD